MARDVDTKETEDIFEEKWTKPSKKELPWELQAVYNLNYGTALIYNKTVGIYLSLGLEKWLTNTASTVNVYSSLQTYLTIALILFVKNWKIAYAA